MTAKKKGKLTDAIRETGMTLTEFVEEKLQDSYANFYYRLNHNCLRLDDYHKICFYTGKSFESLFPNPYKTPTIEPIPFRLPSNSINAPVQRTTPAQITPVQAIESPRIEERAEPVFRPALNPEVPDDLDDFII